MRFIALGCFHICLQLERQLRWKVIYGGLGLQELRILRVPRTSASSRRSGAQSRGYSDDSMEERESYIVTGNDHVSNWL